MYYYTFYEIYEDCDLLFPLLKEWELFDICRNIQSTNNDDFAYFSAIYCLLTTV
jgi:hypothetical protein